MYSRPDSKNVACTTDSGLKTFPFVHGLLVDGVSYTCGLKLEAVHFWATLIRFYLLVYYRLVRIHLKPLDVMVFDIYWKRAVDFVADEFILPNWFSSSSKNLSVLSFPTSCSRIFHWSLRTWPYFVGCAEKRTVAQLQELLEISCSLLNLYTFQS